MEKGKNILGRSIVAATVLSMSGFTASAAGAFDYTNLGTGEQVRTVLLQKDQSKSSLELKCGEKGKTGTTTATTKGKEGKCGEGKCGEKKSDKKTKKKGKEASCGSGK